MTFKVCIQMFDCLYLYLESFGKMFVLWEIINLKYTTDEQKKQTKYGANVYPVPSQMTSLLQCFIIGVILLSWSICPYKMSVKTIINTEWFF